MSNAQKYPNTLKAEITDKYRPYRYTIRMLSEEYGIPMRTIRDWITPGADKYPESLKAEIRAKYQPHVYTLDALAAEYGICRGTIYLWVKS